MAGTERIAGATAMQSYTFGKRLRAFGRGSLEGAPFRKIAEEGLRANYSLGPGQEDAYIRRIGFGLAGEARLVRLFWQEMPERRQEKIAEILDFMIEYLSFQAEEHSAEDNKAAALWVRFKMQSLRERIVDALCEGRVTSVTAQRALAGCLERKPEENEFPYLALLRAQITCEGSKAGEGAKGMIREISARAGTDATA